MLSAEKMVLEVQRGNRRYLEELFKRFEPLVKSLARRYAHKGGSYEDLKQQGYLILLELFLRYREGKVRLEGYLKKSLELHLRKYYLKEIDWKKRMHLLNNLSADFDLSRKRIFEEFCLPLSPMERKLLELYYLWGYNDKHISLKLGRSRSWVNLKRRRLVESLRKQG